MSNTCTTKQTFDDLKICVIIPTYNNATTVAKVITEVLQFTNNVIVVNDGSTDDTPTILDSIQQIVVAGYPKNAGKGMALRTGFRKAIEQGYQFAITIDSDGQHYASDLPVFIDKLKQEGACLMMGARNMDTAENVPGKSSFGNKFSNFWYRFETGIDLPDTQTGYRLYPLEPISKMKFFTRKYEFEIEAIVRLAWAGVKVVSVPITVYYPPKGERISHFRPFKDFTRISLVNTVLVSICFLYIWPRNFFRRFSKENWKQELRRLLLKPGETDLTKANSIGFGVFMGIVPIWGFQLLTGIPLAHFLKLNKTLFILAANISIPPMIPFVIFLSYQMGRPFMGSRAMNLSFSELLSLQDIGRNIEQYIYGSIFLAIAAGFMFWLITFVFLKARRGVAGRKEKANS